MAQCYRCKSEILEGQATFIGNRPAPRTPFHADKAICAASGWSATKADSATSSAASAAPGSIDALIDARIDARLEGFEPSAALDEAAVRRIALEAVGHTLTLEVKRPDGSSAQIKGAHYLFPRVLNCLAAGLNVALWGPPGTAKTTALKMAAEALGVPFEGETFSPMTAESKITGYCKPNGEPVFTAFARVFTRGGLYCMDEADNAPGVIQNTMNMALANGHAGFAWGPESKHERSYFGAAMNTPGLGRTPRFPDRMPMSNAFRDRLYLIYWPRDPNLTRSACGLPAIAPPQRKERTVTDEQWFAWVESMMDWAEREAPTLNITDRAIYDGRKALRAGETPDEVADGLVFRGADASLRAKALSACPLP